MRIVLISGVLISFAAPAAAQAVGAPPAAANDTILVTGVRQDADKSGDDVSIFERGEMDSVQGPDVTRLLERAPGVAINRNGGPGAFTAVHVRGAESEQLLVLVDGVRVADPAAPGGGFDVGNLLMGNLAKIELQHGSNSTIWGSQALGGVLAVTTGTGAGMSASAEYGSRTSIYATAAIDQAVGPATIGLAAARFATDGFSAAAGGSEPDGFEQTELSARTSVAIGGGLRAFATGRYAKGRVDLDGFPAPDFALADTAEYQDTRQLSGAAGLEYSSHEFQATADWSSADTRRSNFDPASGDAPTFTADGLSERVELRGSWSFAPHLALAFGGERERTRFATLFDAEHRTAIAGAYGQLSYDRGPLHLSGGVRHDQHRDFGGAWSLGGDAAFALGSGWRLLASYGEGFKAPTLFQLHSDFGNTGLRPETAASYDAGIAYAGGMWEGRVTAFRRDTRDLIVFASCFGQTGGICAGRPFGTYDNAGQARAQGVELEAAVHATAALRLGTAYTFLDAIDRTPGSATGGKALARRPRHALTLTGDWSRGALRLGADLRVVSDSFDDAANSVSLAGYTLATLRGELDVGKQVTLFGRIENALDAVYQTAAGYATARRAAYVGARARL